MTTPKDAAHFLAFDLGAGSGRAVLGTLDGAEADPSTRFAASPTIRSRSPVTSTGTSTPCSTR